MLLFQFEQSDFDAAQCSIVQILSIPLSLWQCERGPASFGIEGSGDGGARLGVIVVFVLFVVGECGVGGVYLAATALVFCVIGFRHCYYKRKISKLKIT